jgi:hypothetical protein
MLLFCLLLWLYMHIETVLPSPDAIHDSKEMVWDDPRSGGLWMGGQLTGARPF